MNHVTGAQLGSFLGELLAGGEPASIPARGFSMHPFIREDDVIIITPCFRPESGPGEFKVGDVVLFRSKPDRWLIHRIIRKHAHGKREKFVTKGDALLQADPPIEPGRVWGRVAGFIRARSSKKYELETAFQRKLSFILASLSGMEETVFRVLFPRLFEPRSHPVIKKTIRLPKWIVTRIFFP